MEEETGVPRRYLMGVSSIPPEDCDDSPSEPPLRDGADPTESE